MKISRYLYLNRIILKCIKRIYFPCIIVSLIFFQCTPSQKQFTELSPDEVGLNFRNDIVETQHTNIMTYEYTYNGAGIAAGDINSDGLTDLYFSGNSVGNKLFINKGKWHFEDITTPSQTGGRKDWKTGVTMADVNGDGWLDIYVCKSGKPEKEKRHNELFLNNGNLTFREVSEFAGLADLGLSTQAVFFDFDKDGDL